MAPHRTVPAAPTAREIEVHSPWMRRLARALVGEADAADDVVQDAWARLAGAPTERGVHVGYLVGLVRSLAHGRRRGEARRAAREAHSARVEALPSTAEVAARVEVARRLAEALGQLDEPYRTTLVLRYYDELSAAEIARRADIPAGTVRARLKRGLDLMRARLDDGDGGRASWMSALIPLLPAHPRSPAVGAATTTTTMLAASALLTMKLTLGATVCALAAFLAWTFVEREGAGERALDASVGDGAALVAPELAVVADSAARQGTTLEAVPPEIAIGGDPRATGPADSGSNTRVVARATTRDGRPVEGAWLRVALAEQQEARAALDGRLELTLERPLLERLASVSQQGSVGFLVGAQGFANQLVHAELVAGREDLVLGDVMLGPAGAVHGRVIDESGLGVEGALVAFGALPSPQRGKRDHARSGPFDLLPMARSEYPPTLATYSGPGGTFRIEGVPVGYGIAWARTSTSAWVYSAPVGLRAGEEVGDIELVVRDAPGTVIAGRVVDPDGRALPGIDLMFQPSSGSSSHAFARSDAQGRFHFVASNVEAQTITVQAPSIEWGTLIRTDVAPGTHDLELRFEHAPQLHVVVLDDAGRPIVNGKALGVPATGATLHPIPRCEAELDRAGRAHLIDPGCALRVRIEAAGYRHVLLGPFEPSAFPEPLVVTLAPVPALIGRVQLPDGTPAAGARVSLHRSASGPEGTAAPQTRHVTHQGWSGDRGAFVYALHAAPLAAVRADDEGRFRLPLPGVDVRPEAEAAVPLDFSELGVLAAHNLKSQQLIRVDARQPWFLHAVVDGHATITSGPHVFDPARDASLDLQLPLGGAIAGKLVLDGVGSVHGWTAQASDGLAEVARAAVAEDGTFRFENLHAGPWQIRMFEPAERFFLGGNMRTERVPEPDVHVVAGSTVEYEHRAHVRATARLVGQLSIDGAPPGALLVRASTRTLEAAYTTSRATLDPDGRFEVTLQPGLETQLMINGPYRGAVLWLEAQLQIVPGENDWSFALETARLEVHVDPTGLPATPFHPVTYRGERGPVTMRVQLQSSEPGHYGPIVVPSGRGRLDGPTDNPRAPAPVWAELDLAPGELRVLDLR